MEEEKGIDDNDSNIIFIGKKPMMNYVTGIAIQFKKRDEDIVSARGKFISKAVDVVEVVKKTLLKDMNIVIGEIKIGSNGFKNKEGKSINVSTIDIPLFKK